MQKGFHNTTVQEIASMEGISTGLIYRYFTGKSEIIAALVSNVVERLQQKIQADNILEGDSSRLTLFARDKVNDDARYNIALMLAISAEASRNARDSEIRTRLYIFSLLIDGLIMRENVNIAQHNAAFRPLLDELIRQMTPGVNSARTTSA